MRPNDREELFNLIPAYAIGALDDDERARFEAWLRDDPQAQAILSEYEQVAQHLGTLAPLRPAPDHLQADLRRRLADSARTDRPERDPRAAGESGQVSGARRSIWQRRATWIYAVAAVLVVVVAGLLVTQLDAPDEEATPTPDPATLYARLEQQPGSQQYTVVPGEVDDAVSGDLLVSETGEQAVLRLSSLPPITSQQTFQMWLVDDSGTRTSGGLFQPRPAQEMFYVHVPFEETAAAYQGVGVSLEPVGGSPFADRPTGPRVLSVPLSQ